MSDPWWRRVWNAARTTLQPPARSRVIRVGRTAGGVYVNADEVLKNATVWACIRYLTHAVAQTPWRVYRERQGGGRELMTTNPADYLLNKRPSPDMGSFTWRQAMLGMALRHGNAYAEIERDMRGAAVALWPIHPDRVTVRRGPDGRLLYDVSQPSSYTWGASTPLAGGVVTLDASDMFHLRGFGEGPVGFNVIEYAAQSIGWAQATEIFGATFFGEGMNPSGVVTKPTKMTPQAFEETRRELKRLYEGPRGERTVILDAGMTFEKLATAPNDAQFIETRQHQVDEICRWFGVPPHKVMHLLRATFSNIEHQSIEVVVDCVTPWCKTFEEEADYKLFGSNRMGLFTRMDLRALMRGDNTSRANYFSKLWQIGALSINEIRAFEDEDPIGEDGDSRFVPVNYTTLERAIEGPAAAGMIGAPDTDDGDVPPTEDDVTVDGEEPATGAPAPGARVLRMPAVRR